MEQKLGQKPDLDEVRTIRSMLQAVPDTATAIDSFKSSISSLESSLSEKILVAETKLHQTADLEEVRKNKRQYPVSFRYSRMY